MIPTHMTVNQIATHNIIAKKHSKHNVCGSRCDVWFYIGDRLAHGAMYGHSGIFKVNYLKGER